MVLCRSKLDRHWGALSAGCASLVCNRQDCSMHDSHNAVQEQAEQSDFSATAQLEHIGEVTVGVARAGGSKCARSVLFAAYAELGMCCASHAYLHAQMCCILSLSSSEL